ncbi:DUF6233 domain-containing protein [Streptomyces sp. NPDC055722]
MTATSTTPRFRRVDSHEAVAALREGVAACVVCRPDAELPFGD